MTALHLKAEVYPRTRHLAQVAEAVIAAFAERVLRNIGSSAGIVRGWGIFRSGNRFGRPRISVEARFARAHRVKLAFVRRSSSDRLDSTDKQSGGILPSGKPSRCGASVGSEPPPFSRIADQTAQCLCQCRRIVRRHQQTGPHRHCLGDCARHGRHDRNPVCDRFGECHPISLETRREHKYTRMPKTVR